MLIEQWTDFGTSPLGLGIGWSTGLGFMTYAVANFVHDRTVPGTYRAYRSATIAKTLLWPVFAGYVYCAVIALVTQNWGGAIVSAWICATLARDWERFKDTDDWWKGRGTKLKTKLKSLFTASSPAMAGAGA